MEQERNEGAATAVFRISIDGGRGFSCLSTESVLAAMVRQGVPGVPVGCRGGGCGVCRVRVLSGQFRAGKVARTHVTGVEQRQGYALACRLYPQSDLSVIPAAKPAAPKSTICQEETTNGP